MIPHPQNVKIHLVHGNLEKRIPTNTLICTFYDDHFYFPLFYDPMYEIHQRKRMAKLLSSVS